MQHEHIEHWSDAINSHITRERIACIDRAVVVRETGSTQDVARAMAGGRPGLAIFAGRQTGGRGRLGRGWADTSHMGIAATFTIESSPGDAARLSLAAGLAALVALDAILTPINVRIGLRWPNDVVEHCPRGKGRKLSGVLIEHARSLAYIGIGINIGQRESDWPDDLRGRAVSAAQLGAEASRIDVILDLIVALDAALRSTDEELRDRWNAREVLLGTRQTFEHSGERYTGTVVGVDPSHGVRVHSDEGDVHHLPALTTSLVHG